VRRTVSLLELNYLFEKIQSQERRLTPLPGEHHLFVVLVLDVLPDKRLKHLIGYAPPACLL